MQPQYAKIFGQMGKDLSVNPLFISKRPALAVLRL